MADVGHKQRLTTKKLWNVVMSRIRSHGAVDNHETLDKDHVVGSYTYNEKYRNRHATLDLTDRRCLVFLYRVIKGTVPALPAICTHNIAKSRQTT